MSLKSSCSSLRQRTPYLPMPDKDALYRSFNQLLGSLDLPDDKIGELNSYDDQKKWEILCSRSLMKVHQSPSFYLQRLRSYVGLKTKHSKTDVAELLRGLEVSLRTYSVEWLHNFLSEKHSLDIFNNFIDYNLPSEQLQIISQCLKVIVSDSMGLCAVINHHKLLDNLVRILPAVSAKNKCSILQLLVMVCEKSQQGHDRILKSLKPSGFKQIMDFLILDKNLEQMVISSTINLMKAVVNSPIDLNYQVYLQFELRQIGLESRLQRLMLNESRLISEVIKEIKNYESMIINVNQLVKDREAFKEGWRREEATIIDEQEQSINRERSSEVRKKDDQTKTLEKNSKVDKRSPDTDHKPEILQKSTVKIAPTMKAKSEVTNTMHNIAIQGPPPPPPLYFSLPIKRQAQVCCRLPTFNWLPLPPNRIRGTIFNGLDDERLRKIINFTHFEDKFHINDSSQSKHNSPSKSRSPTFASLLGSTRLRNVSILLRKLNLDADAAVEAINVYEVNQLDLDSIQLLTNLAPRDSETEAYRNYITQKKDIAELSEEDKFLMKLSQVERLMTKLNVMDFLGNFNDRVDSLNIQLCAVTSASLSLKNSKKFRSILEIILTFGNYMNSNKSCGLAYGFRIKGAIEGLNNTRSNDKKMSLFEYMVEETIAKKFPNLLTLDSELLCINEAARISMKNISNEVMSIKSGWRKLTEERKLSMNFTLKAFESTSSVKFNKLINELETALNSYNECICYFGEESTETMDSDEFFSIVCKFLSQFKQLSFKVKI